MMYTSLDTRSHSFKHKITKKDGVREKEWKEDIANHEE